jgi:hypothetical protein
LEIKWGDGYSGILQRVLKQEINNTIRKNLYVGLHAFSGEGTYFISFEDPNRNYGIVNIPNSVNVPMYVDAKLVINNSLGPNNSPLLLSNMYMIGNINSIVTYNPGVYDADGDSLAYKLSVCKGGGGLPIPGYTLPAASNLIGIDHETGDFLWDSPVLQGTYSIYILIEEWRQGIMIGTVHTDMNINIDAGNGNDVPVITAISDTIVFPGEELFLDVSASSLNLKDVSLVGYGGPFLVPQSPALFPEVAPQPEVLSVFSWAITSAHIREQPYNVCFKAVSGDYWSPVESYKTVKIQVLEYQSIEENIGNEIIKVNYNNPVNKNLNLKLECDIPMQLYYDIYSVNGKSLLSGYLGIQKYYSKTIDFSTYLKGVYFLKVHDGVRFQVIKKVVKLD